MGQKVHPTGFRLGYTKTWSSTWYADKQYANFLHEDLKIRDFIKKRFPYAGIAKVDIARAGEKAKITIHTARPGLVIGRRGAEVDQLRYDIQEFVGRDIFVNIVEVRTPELNAQLVAENIALQLERRVSFRRAMKMALTTGMRFGAKGIKISVAGRLGGAEIARQEWYREGRVPLHTLRADIDYGFAISRTTFGAIGVKVWVFHEELSPEALATGKETKQRPAAPRTRG
ncbi:MAG: 30S ribosomal protein S3 [Candidatus Hydrogenedentes bacterium]|nr:30S ribosomal protein S3 [Candidatus Hydrogenedentota bacterium]